MEGYARHSRSHFRAAPPPPASAGAGTAYCKKAYSNGAAAGGNGFMAYDDVFGGPPKFGATPFAPRAEDYSEIFGSFRSSRSSSIPMLDLPPVDDSVAAFEVLDCSGLEYSDIFGGFDFADFAASYDELFRGSDGSEQSSDEAWTPAGTESPSGESDLYNSSGKNQYFLNGDFHETFEDKLFDVSYHNVNPGTAEDSELIHEAQLPGHTYIIEGSNIIKEDEERYSSGVADDVILCEDDSSGNVLVEAPWKKSSVWSHSCVVKQSREYSEKAGGAHGSLTPSCVSFCDVSLKTEPSHLPPASRLPPTIVDRKKYPSTSTSDYEQSNSNTAETIFGGGSFDCFDVEPNAGSSSITPAAAIKEAMDRAKIKINSAKEVMKRKEEGVKDMPFMNNDLNNDGKVRMVVDESISGDDELLSTHEREPTAVKILGDNLQVVSEASHVLPGSLPEDAVSTTAKTAQRKIAKKKNSTLDPVLTEEDGEWKVTTDCFELVNNGNSKTDPSLPGNINKPVQEINMYHFDNANGKTMHFQKLGQIVEGIDASVTEHEDSESVDGACNPTENRRRLRANKAASRNTFHEKMVKLAQDVHETVISGHVETVKRGKEEGLEGDGTNQNPEKHLVGERNERRFDQAAQGVRYDRQHKEESYLARIEIRSEEEPVQANCDKKGKDDCRLKENEMRSTEVAAREETVKRDEFTEKKDNWRRLNDAHQNEEREEACTRRHTEEMKKVLPHRDENLSVLYEALEQKDGKGKSGKDEKQDSDVRLEKVDEETSERENEICEKEAHETERCEEFAATSDFYGTKEKECVDSKNFGKHDVATENISAVAITAADNEPTKRMRLERSDGTCNDEDEVHNCEEEMEELIQTSELEKPQKVDECSATNEEEKMERKVDLQADLKITDLHNNQEQSLQIESEHFISVGPFTLDEAAAEMAYEHEELKSSHLPSSPDDEDIKSSDSACESEEKLRNHAADDMPIDEEKAEFKSGTLYSEMESKLADMEDICMSTRYPQKLEADHPMMSERKESAQKQYQSTNMNQRVGKEAKAVDGVLAAEDREMAKNLKRKEESDRERTSELQLEKEREKERELEKERLRKLEEERDKERENELEMLRVRRLEELREREREREKELAKEHLRKLEEERQREREKDFEKERLRKLEEEWEREREREKDRMGVELKMSAARERVSVEVRERAERAAVERATAEARQRAMAEARERLEKACAEAREKSVGKASKDAQLRAERAAVERATAEARERAIEKAIAERATFETRERVERSVSEKFSASFRDVGLRHCSSSNDLWNSDKSDGVQGESAQRCKARLERHRRTVERVAKALAEKNMRDLIAQREQAERNRLAETLDADIKRWSNGKEGNLRALLSTLQYILGPDSGWHPVPLTDVITSAAVKKAYRKATLCVHPDKLQQRGATIQQKYICEKVFDLLKDAWNRFNSEER